METNTNQQSSSNKLLIILGIAFVVLVFSFLALGFLAKSALQKNTERGIAKVIKKELGKNADVNLNNDSVEVKTEEGSFSTSTKIPDNFRKDIPLYPNSKVISSTTENLKDSTQGTAGTVAFETEGSNSKVAEYLLAELKKNGWESIENYTSGNSYTFSAKKDTVTVVISINDNATTPDKVTYAIAYAPE